MKKSVVTLLSLIVGASVFAYNPPAGGQNILKISSPELLTGAKSTAGGAIFNVTPDSVVNNPALPGFCQRSSIEVAGSMFFDSKDEEHSMGGAFEIGSLFATRWCVPTVLIQGVFVPYADMHLGNSINLNAGYSKDITDSVSVGLGLNAGYLWGAGTDWTLSGSLGAYYEHGDAGFLKDLRFGITLVNLGKMYTNTEVLGITGSMAKAWPGLATLKTGAAALLVDANNFEMGLSLDFSVPAFQNFVFDAGLQMKFFDVVKLSAGWEFDLREFKEGSKNLMPSVGLSCNITIKSKSEAFSKRGWEQSEITASAAWQRMYENIDAVSAGVILDLGLEDTQAPEIIMW